MGMGAPGWEWGNGAGDGPGVGERDWGRSLGERNRLGMGEQGWGQGNGVGNGVMGWEWAGDGALDRGMGWEWGNRAGSRVMGLGAGEWGWEWGNGAGNRAGSLTRHCAAPAGDLQLLEPGRCLPPELWVWSWG